MVQQKLADAPNGDDRAARWLLELDMRDDASRAAFDMSVLEWFIPRKTVLLDEFDRAERRGEPPPDCVPHPAQIAFIDGQFIFTGPTDARGRASWELLKYKIRSLADASVTLRQRQRDEPADAATIELLADVSKKRRALMRLVPKGWNWREDIYALDNPDHGFKSAA